MPGSVALLAAIAALAATPVAAETTAVAPRLAELASGLCVEVLAGRTALPTDVSSDDTFNAGYGLASGIPPAVMQALGPDVTLLAQARLASGETAEGPFVVAMGGRAGQTCRLIVMRGAQDSALGPKLHAAMQAAPLGWRDVPVTRQSTAAVKLSLFNRDSAGLPFLANILTPTEPGPVAMVVTVAAIPPNVTLPEGY
jgi:hypothetical protein